MIFFSENTQKLHRRCDFWSCRHFVDRLSVYVAYLIHCHCQKTASPAVSVRSILLPSVTVSIPLE